MAGDWIKMRTDLRNHPKVVRMASALKADRLRVIGGLWAVWATFDTHSADGLLEGYTLAAIDDDLGWRGFGAAMQAIGWLEESESGLAVPEFDEHNGASAKRRAQDTKLKKSNRSADKEANGSWTPSGQMSASEADNSRTREELNKKKPTVSKRTASLSASDLESEGVDATHAADWLKTRKAPLTQTAWDGVKREAEKAGLSPGEAVRIAAERAWRGFDASWLARGAGGGHGSTDDIFAGAR